jgi:GTP-binding protein
LLDKPVLVAANKIDQPGSEPRRQALEDFCQRQGLDFLALSALRGDGLDKLRYHLGERLQALAAIPQPSPATLGAKPSE